MVHARISTSRLNTFLPLLTSILFIFLLLTNPVTSISLVKNGLSVWYHNMIPSLFPFMVLSGILLRTDLSYVLSKLLYPFLGTLFRLSPNCIYVILMGFLCGFPMGAAIVADSLSLRKITLRESELLLAFCNNIGPIYFISFVSLMCPYYPLWITLPVMYLVPLFYGFILRYTRFRDIPLYHPGLHTTPINHSISYGRALQESLQKAITSILLLGGYMVIFNVLQLPFYNSFYQLPEPYINVLKGLIEISSGITALGPYPEFYGIVYTLFLPFCGLCCLFQTYAMIKDTPLSLTTYTNHKLIQTLGTIGIYGIIQIFV